MFYPCLAVLPLLVLSVRCSLLTNLGRFHAAHAGFIQVEEDSHAVNVLDRYNLFIAAFNPFPFTTDHVYEVAAIGRKLANINRTQILDVSHRITWPNEISQVPGRHCNSGVRTYISLYIRHLWSNVYVLGIHER